MCYLRHAEPHARNRISLAGLDQNLFCFGTPYISTVIPLHKFQMYVLQTHKI